MALSPSFLEFAKELFEPFGEISIRKMFGGAGAYCDGLFFAILDDDAVFLKVDHETRSTFESAGLEPFVFEMKDGSSGTMNYHAVPDDFYDDADVRKRWTILALDAASRAAKFKKKPAREAAAKKSATTKAGTKNPKPQSLKRKSLKRKR